MFSWFELGGCRSGPRVDISTPRPGPNTDDAMTRSEDEVRVGKAATEKGRARLSRYVVSEQVQTTVQSPTRSSWSWRRSLVPKGRLRLARDAVTEEAPVNTEVHKEQIDTGNLER